MEDYSIWWPQELIKDQQEAGMNRVDARCSNMVHDISEPDAADWKK